MVQPAFDIVNGQSGNLPADSRLLIEISGQSFNYILYGRNPDRLLALRQYRMYTTGERTIRDLLEEIISGDSLLQQFSEQAVVVYNFPASNLLPEKLYHPDLNSAVSRLVYGDKESEFIFDEQLPEGDMHNIYSVSRDIHSFCREKFKGSQYWHFYTILLLWSQRDALKKGYFTRVVFYNDKFIAAFYKETQLQLIQTFFLSDT